MYHGNVMTHQNLVIQTPSTLLVMQNARVLILQNRHCVVFHHKHIFTVIFAFHLQLLLIIGSVIA